MKYLPLAELRIAHAYYRSGRCPDLEVAPSAAGARTIANHRLVLKPRPDGVQLLAPVDDADAPFIAFAPDTTLGFELRARNPDLALFTDLAALRATPAPRYFNPDASPGGELQLGPGTPRPGLPAGLFAELELRGVDASWLVAGPARFTLSLASRSARWLYYVVTDYRDGDVELVDAAEAPLEFTPSTGADLSLEPDPDDRQAAALAAQYPGARLLRFVSAAAVACAEEPRRKLELRLGGERLPLTLPNPALTALATLAITVDTIPQRQESLFRVVKHLTHSFPANG